MSKDGSMTNVVAGSDMVKKRSLEQILEREKEEETNLSRSKDSKSKDGQTPKNHIDPNGN